MRLLFVGLVCTAFDVGFLNDKGGVGNGPFFENGEGEDGRCRLGVFVWSSRTRGGEGTGLGSIWVCGQTREAKLKPLNGMP